MVNSITALSDYKYVGKHHPGLMSRTSSQAKPFSPPILSSGYAMCKILRSPHAHAQVVKIDISRALEFARR